MTRIDLDLEEMLEGFTRDGMKRFVKKLIMASDKEEKRLLSQLKSEKNDLADLDEEMHGKPNTPKVEKGDMPNDDEGELPPVPKKRKS